MSNNGGNRIKGLLVSACVIFTVAVFFLYLLGLIITDNPALNLKMLLTTFVGSLILSVINLLFTAEKIKPGVRYLLHYLATAVLFFLVFFVLSGNASNGSRILIIMVAFTVAYGVFVLVSLLVGRKRTDRREEKESYKSLYNNDREQK